MNLKFIKENLLLGLFVTGFVALIGTGFWYQRRTAAHLQETDTELAKQRANLEKYRKATPFPSRENLETLRNSSKQAADLFSQITALAGKSIVEIPEYRPIQWQQNMTKTLDRLLRECDSNKIRTPLDFRFGFSRYSNRLPCGGRGMQPESKECQAILAQLSKQLILIEHLTNLLITNQVEELRSIRRTEVESGETGFDALATGSTEPSTAAKDSQPLYRTMPFELTFVCTTDGTNHTGGLRGILNDLMQSPYFLAVRGFKVESETIEEQRTGSGGTVIAQSLSPTSPPALIPLVSDLAARRNRLVVTLNIELTEFTTSQTASTLPIPAK